MTTIRWLLAGCVAWAVAPGPLCAQDPAPAADTLRPPAASGRAVVPGELLRRTGEGSLLASLAGRVPNLEVVRTSGEAGSAVAVRIRGQRSFVGGGPLVVVDGLPVAAAAHSTWAGAGVALAGVIGSDRAADVNLDDVQTVEVLRGPAATARYGVRGSGGVIRVTTKRGRSGRTVYTLSSAAGRERAARSLPLQRTFGLGTQGRSTACTAPNCSVPFASFSWGPQLPAGTPTYDHSAELFETGTTFDNTLAVSGGDRRTAFRLSGGVLSRDGYLAGDGDGYDRRTLHLNASHRLGDELSVGASVSLSRTEGRYAPRANGPNDVLAAALRTPPEFDNREYLTAEGLHRSYRFPDPRPGSERASRLTDNPFYLLREGEHTQEVARHFGSAGATWRPLGWLRVDYTLGVDDYADDRREVRPPQSTGILPGGTAGSWRLEERAVEHDLSATAEYRPGSALSGRLAAGGERSERRFRHVHGLRSGLGEPTPPTSGDRGRDGLLRTLTGYFVQGSLDYAEQVSLLGSVRSDGVSTGSGSGRRAWYPAGSVAWSFARTLGLPRAVVGAGSLRLAYGRSGREPGPYLLQDLVLFTPPRASSGGVTVFSPRGLRGAAELGPELTTELETGLDLGLFGGRTELGVTWFRADSRGVVVPLPAAGDAASSTRLANAGEIRNTGWEVALGVRPYTRPKLAFELGLHWARTRSEVVGLGGFPVVPYPFEAASLPGARTVAEVGRPLGVVRGLDFARCGRGLSTLQFGGAAHDVAAACQGAPDGALFLAPGGFPVPDPNERVIADPNPDWTGAVTAELRIFGARVGALVETRQGGQTLNLTRAALYQYGTHEDTGRRGAQVTFGVDWMRGPVVGPGTDRLVTLDQAWFSSWGGLPGPWAPFVEDASSTRLRELSLAYTFEGPWLRRMLGLTAIDARLAGRNLYTWTDYTGFDPEPSPGGAVLASRGIDWFAGPPSRAVLLSVSLTR